MLFWLSARPSSLSILSPACPTSYSPLMRPSCSMARLCLRFRHPERQGEEPIFGAALKERGDVDAVIEMPQGIWLEGAGGLYLGSYAPPVLDGLRSAFASRSGRGRCGEL